MNCFRNVSVPLSKRVLVRSIVLVVVLIGGVARPESSKGVGEKDGDKTSTPFAMTQGVPPDRKTRERK